MSKIPLLVIGDSPTLPTGLGRICKDLLSLLYRWQEDLGIEVAGLGWEYRDEPLPWPQYAVRDSDEWAKGDLPKTWWRLFGNRRGVVFTIWDPSRCFGLSDSAQDSPVQLWGYFAIDGANRHGGISGPALVTLKRYRRILAYTEFGAAVLGKGLGSSVGWLPHGLLPEAWQNKDVRRVALLGCNMSNQPRKDWGIAAEVCSMLAERRPDLSFWWHTDKTVRSAWSLPQLAEDFGLGERLLVTASEDGVQDADLAALYSQCAATFLPSLGEGFGYPIVESLAAGAPCAHWDGAGGGSLVPRPEWLWKESGWRIEGPYALRRPVFSAGMVARAVEAALDFSKGVEAESYCRGAVAALDWRQLAARWREWFREELEEMR